MADIDPTKAMPARLARWLDKKTCPDCGVKPGEPHLGGCDIERCLSCEDQAIGCSCETPSIDGDVRQVWTGIYPGAAEAIEKGYFAKWTGFCWMPCSMEDPDARPDLNTYYVERFEELRKARNQKRD